MNRNQQFNITVQALHQMSGSCFLFTVFYPDGKSEKFVIDCGRFNDEEDENLNEFFPFDPRECSFLIISHAHDDHIARTPLFVKHGFKGKIYSTDITCKFANFILYNASYMYENYQEGSYIEPLYNDNDVSQCMKQFETFPYRRIIKPTKNISFIFYENGHIPGSAIIYLIVKYPGEKDITILFTGDYNYKNLFYDVPNLPDIVTKNYISLLITEATYGTTNSYDGNDNGKLVNTLSNALLNGKTIIIPSFALARVDNCIYLIGNAQKDNLLPDVPIYLAGYSARFFHNMFLHDNLGLSINLRDLLPPTLKKITSNIMKHTIIENREPKIIIAPGGCSDYGSIVGYLINGIPRDDVLVFYSGYTSQSSTGNMLRNVKKGDFVNYHGNKLKVNCDVDSTSELSAHARRDEFFKYLFSPCSCINSFITTHGELNTCLSFARDISHEFPNATVGTINSNICYTINSSGIIKADNISIY